MRHGCDSEEGGGGKRRKGREECPDTYVRGTAKRRVKAYICMQK